MIKGVIFDMDGVLVSSEEFMVECAKAALEKYGVFPEKEDFEPFVGAGEDRFIGGVSEKYGVPYKTEMKEFAYSVYVEKAETGVRRFKEIPELFQRLHDAGLLIAIASSADEIKVRTNIRVAGIPESTISAFLTGSQVERKKPFPDIFIEAANRLGLAPENCIVIEDAVNGIQAASAAGMISIGVTGSFPAETLLAEGAYHTVDETRDVAEWILVHCSENI